MRAVIILCTKAIRIGPLPYLGLSVAILLVGVVLQLRTASPVMDGGTTLFGMFARIAGFIGLFGLVPLCLGINDDSDDAEPPETSGAAPDGARARDNRNLPVVIQHDRNEATRLPALRDSMRRRFL